jgi:hypothetical protein
LRPIQLSRVEDSASAYRDKNKKHDLYPYSALVYTNNSCLFYFILDQILADLVDFLGHRICLKITFGVTKTLSPMKKLNLLAAITVACSALISGLQAAPITYSIVDNAAYQNGYTVSGSITTDGTTGSLSSSNITNWTYAVTNTATSVVAFTESGTFATVGRIEASATQFTLLAGSGFDGAAVQLDGRWGSLGWYRYPEQNYGNFDGVDYIVPAMEIYRSAGAPGSGSGSYTTFWNNNVEGTLPLGSTADGSWIIAEVSTVPEPSTYGLLFGGFTLAVVAMRRRTSKQA